MTLKSMTGFGQGFAQGGGVRVDVEISSVNRKQLDVVVSLPRPLQALESFVQERLSRQMSRGRIQVQAAVQSTGKGGATPVQVDQALARHCLAELQGTARRLGLDATVSITDLIRIPGVLMVREAGQDMDAVKPVLAKAMERAMRSFNAMRKREGATLRDDLATRIGQIEAHVSQIVSRAPGLADRYRKMLRARIDRLTADLPIADERLEKEVVLFADRADITEEVTRLGSHIQQARGMLRQQEPAGRSLDFLAQEMFREINTIAAKASDSVISTMVVHIKAELERFREQVQNIE